MSLSSSSCSSFQLVLKPRQPKRQVLGTALKRPGRCASVLLQPLYLLARTFFNLLLKPMRMASSSLLKWGRCTERRLASAHRILKHLLATQRDAKSCCITTMYHSSFHFMISCWGYIGIVEKKLETIGLLRVIKLYLARAVKTRAKTDTPDLCQQHFDAYHVLCRVLAELSPSGRKLVAHRAEACQTFIHIYICIYIYVCIYIYTHVPSPV